MAGIHGIRNPFAYGFLKKDLVCQFCFLNGTSARHLVEHLYIEHNHCRFHKITFSCKKTAFDHLENIHKETGRHCHHCTNFYSFDENVMKKHIFDNHRENLKMTRRNTKDAEKLYAAACKKEKKKSTISSNTTTLKSKIKSEKDDTSELEIEKHPIKIEVKMEVSENGIKKEVDDNQPQGDALKKSTKTEPKVLPLEKNIKKEKEDISENQFEKHPINIEMKKELDENFVSEQKSMCS